MRNRAFRRAHDYLIAKATRLYPIPDALQMWFTILRYWDNPPIRIAETPKDQRCRADTLFGKFTAMAGPPFYHTV